jgi:hypothetical protein
LTDDKGLIFFHETLLSYFFRPSDNNKEILAVFVAESSRSVSVSVSLEEKEASVLALALTLALFLYPERDLNPHSRYGHRILSPACLPFHHPGKYLSCSRAVMQSCSRWFLNGSQI